MNKIDFVCFSQNTWEKRRARKQQFMLHLSFREDVDKVFYVEPPLNLFRLILLPFSELRTKGNRGRWLRALKFKIERSSESQKLFIYTPIFFIPFSFRIQAIHNLNRYISLLIIKTKLKRLNFENIVLWLYHPFDYCILKWFKDRMVSCFDWAEDWAEFFVEYPLKKRKYISYLEEKIIKEVDLVFVVSQVLLKRAQKLNKNSHQILDGTVPEIFDNYDGRIPDEMKKIPHPILGYTGTVNKRVDMDLITELSLQLPQSSIVLVGNILYPLEKLKRVTHKNIFFLGGKKYNELPNYMMNFDICILPYIPFYLQSPPTKIYDYLATGKPVVSSNIPEMDRFKDCIKTARTNSEFIEFVKESLGEDNPELQELRREKARKNSWLSRTQEIIDIIHYKVKAVN